MSSISNISQPKKPSWPFSFSKWRSCLSFSIFFLASFTPTFAQTDRPPYDEKALLERTFTFQDSILHFREWYHIKTHDSIPLMLSRVGIFKASDFAVMDSLDLNSFLNVNLLIDPQGRAYDAQCFHANGDQCDPLLLDMVRHSLPHLKFLPALENGQATNGKFPLFYHASGEAKPEDILPQLKDKVPDLNSALKLRHYHERRNDCVQGSAWIRLKIGTDGKVLQSVVVQTDDPFISDTVLPILSQLHFSPGFIDGHPVNGWWTHHVYFDSGNCNP